MNEYSLLSIFILSSSGPSYLKDICPISFSTCSCPIQSLMHFISTWLFLMHLTLILIPNSFTEIALYQVTAGCLLDKSKGYFLVFIFLDLQNHRVLHLEKASESFNLAPSNNGCESWRPDSIKDIKKKSCKRVYRL